MLGVYIPPTPFETVTEFYDAASGTWSSPLNRSQVVGYKPGTVDPGIKAPYWDEWIIGLERELPGAAALSVTYIKRRQQQIIDDRELNLWPNYTIEKAEDINGNEYFYFIEHPGIDGSLNPFLSLANISGLRREYTGLELALHADLSPSLRFFGAFTWSKTEGNIDNGLEESTGFSPAYNTPNERINAYGFLSSDRRYTLRASAVYAAPKAFYVSLLLRFDSGAPLDRFLLNPDTGRYEIRSAPRGTLYRKQGSTTIDMRIEKVLQLPRGSISIILDVFNLMDDDSPYDYIVTDVNFGLPVRRASPRSFRWGIRYSF